MIVPQTNLVPSISDFTVIASCILRDEAWNDSNMVCISLIIPELDSSLPRLPCLLLALSLCGENLSMIR